MCSSETILHIMISTISYMAVSITSPSHFLLCGIEYLGPICLTQRREPGLVRKRELRKISCSIASIYYFPHCYFFFPYLSLSLLASHHTAKFVSYAYSCLTLLLVLFPRRFIADSCCDLNLFFFLYLLLVNREPLIFPSLDLVKRYLSLSQLHSELSFFY